MIISKSWPANSEFPARPSTRLQIFWDLTKILTAWSQCLKIVSLHNLIGRPTSASRLVEHWLGESPSLSSITEVTMQDQLPNKIRRRTCRCLYPLCKHRWTQDVPYIHTGWKYDRWGNKGQPVYTPSSLYSPRSKSSLCPKCGGNNTRSDLINGKFSAKQPCNARCTSALGPDCECQCAGENHGIDHLLKI